MLGRYCAWMVGDWIDSIHLLEDGEKVLDSWIDEDGNRFTCREVVILSMEEYERLKLGPSVLKDMAKLRAQIEAVVDFTNRMTLDLLPKGNDDAETS